MKRPSTSALLTAFALSASTLCAQDTPPPRQPDSAPHSPPRHGDAERPRSGPGIFGMLDANHDGGIDPDELSKAGEALRKLDRNGDGRLTPDELQASSGAPTRGPQDHARSDRSPRRDGDRDRQPQENRSRDPRDDRGRQQSPQRSDRRDYHPEASRGDQRAVPPQRHDHDGPRRQQYAQRHEQRGDSRPDGGRGDSPRMAPRMEGAQRPPMSHPDQHNSPGFPPGQPRHDAGPGNDRMMPHPQRAPHPGGPSPRMPEHKGPRPSHDQNFQPPGGPHQPMPRRGPDQPAPGAI